METHVYVCEVAGSNGPAKWDLELSNADSIWLNLDYPTKRQALAHAKRLREALKREK